MKDIDKTGEAPLVGHEDEQALAANGIAAAMRRENGENSPSHEREVSARTASSVGSQAIVSTGGEIGSQSIDEAIRANLEKHRYMVLDEKQLRDALSLLDAWQVRQAMTKSGRVSILERMLPAYCSLNTKNFQRLASQSRLVVRNHSDLQIITKAIRGADILAALSATEMIEASTSKEPRKVTNVRRKRKSLDHIPTEPPTEIRVPIRDRLTDIQTKLLQSMFSYPTFEEMAGKHGLTVSTAERYMMEMRIMAGVTTNGALAVVATAEGIISLDEVPEGRTINLSHAQKEVLRTGYKHRNETTAAILNKSCGHVKNTWQSLCKEMGARNRNQAILMALKDGLIDLPRNTNELYNPQTFTDSKTGATVSSEGTPFAYLTTLLQETVIHMYKPTFEAAKTLGVNVGAMKLRLYKAQKELGLDNLYELALEAARHGMIVDEVPKGRTTELVKRVRTLLAVHYASTHAEAGKALGASEKTISSNYWGQIYRMTGAKNRTQAIIMAYVDRLIKQ